MGNERLKAWEIVMRARVFWGILPSLIVVSNTACFILPGDLISSMVLSPATTCQELAVSLRLGTLPDVSTPDQLGLQYEPFTVTSANGESLSAWFIPAQYQGTLDAENYVGLKCNVEARNLKKVLAVMPALHNPTVNNLSDDGWLAVETVLHTTDIKQVVPKLKRAGASGIIEFPITKIIA